MSAIPTIPEELPAQFADLFRPGGQTYRTVPDLIDRLPKGLQHAATVAWKAVMRFFRDGKLDDRATDRAMGEDAGWSDGLIQKGLNALDVQLEAMGLPPLIERRSGIGMHGRRQIIPAFLAAKGTARATTATGPPSTPPEEFRDTTTGGPSSSSPGSTPEQAGGGGEYPSDELVDRACRLVPRATRGRVVDVVSTYGSDWLSRVLDRIEERNRKPGNKPVKSWGFVLSTLANWRKEGGPPPEDPKPAPAATAPRGPGPKDGPGERLTAEAVAELVAACRSAPSPAFAKIARANLLKALADGAIDPEIAANIPAELLEPISPQAP